MEKDAKLGVAKPVGRAVLGERVPVGVEGKAPVRIRGVDLRDLIRDIAAEFCGGDWATSRGNAGRTAELQLVRWQASRRDTIAERGAPLHGDSARRSAWSGLTMDSNARRRCRDLVRVFAGDGAVEVVEGALMVDDGGFMGVGLIDGAGSAGVDEYLGDLGEMQW